MSFVLQDGMKELYQALKADNVALVARLLQEKPHLRDVETFVFPSWLHDAACAGNLEMVKLLLDYGLEIDKVGQKEETTPLICAMNEDHVHVAKYLLSRGANPNIGRPIIAAINRGDPAVAMELVQLLVEHGADINRHFPWFDSKNVGYTPLAWAESNRKSEIASYLRSKGATIRGDVRERKSD
jgi:uncharacterized protein